ncbi:MAG: peptidylprolyl isomerase [Acidobacteria bacterium]|nr:peptidylprolyl isomerase [Acidobacteriota bacterium]
MYKAILIVLVLISIPLAAQTSTPSHPPVKKTTAQPSPPTAIIDTTAGKMTCTLFPDKAPIGVANFIGLARGTRQWINPASGKEMHGIPLYNGTIFHRVIPGFMIQGGDPLATGTGDPGYKFKNETSSDLNFDRAGRLAYANAGPDTNGSQFFITEQAFTGRQADMLNGHYTIFGQCDDASVDLVKKIAAMPRDQNNNDRPEDPVKINKITILHAGSVHAGTAKKPSPKPAPQASKQH